MCMYVIYMYVIYMYVIYMYVIYMYVYMYMYVGTKFPWKTNLKHSAAEFQSIQQF